MKQITLLFISAIYYAIASGQALTTPLSLISNAGGTAEQVTLNGNSNNSIEWTLGETITGIGQANNQTITIGEQQGLPNNAVTGIAELPFSKVKIFPNPASSYIEIANLPGGNNTITLTDISGKTIITKTITGNSQNISTGQLASGTYLLQLANTANNAATYKITITNR